MSIVRFEPHLMSNLVKRRERWYVKPQEVKGTSGLPAAGPGPLTPRPPLVPQPTHGADRGGLQKPVWVQDLFEQLGAGKSVKVLTGMRGR